MYMSTTILLNTVACVSITTHSTEEYMLAAKQQNAASPAVSNLQKELKAATSCKELLKCHFLSSYKHSHWLSIPMRLCCEEGMGSI